MGSPTKKYKLADRPRSILIPKAVRRSFKVLMPPFTAFTFNFRVSFQNLYGYYNNILKAILVSFMLLLHITEQHL